MARAQAYAGRREAPRRGAAGWGRASTAERRRNGIRDEEEDGMISGYSSASFEIVDSWFVEEGVVRREAEVKKVEEVFAPSDDFYYAALAEILGEV